MRVGTRRADRRVDGSPGGHNGHKSLVQSLGTEGYPRIKIGIGKGEDATIDHVLSRFRPEERVLVDDAVKRAVQTCEVWLADGADAAMRCANAPL